MAGEILKSWSSTASVATVLRPMRIGCRTSSFRWWRKTFAATETSGKSNVVTRSSESHVELGYQMNVVGFGWTNAAFLELLHDLPKDMTERLEREQDQPLPAAGK